MTNLIGLNLDTTACSKERNEKHLMVGVRAGLTMKNHSVVEEVEKLKTKEKLNETNIGPYSYRYS